MRPVRLRGLRLRNPGEAPVSAELRFTGRFLPAGPDDAAGERAAGPEEPFELDLSGYAALPGLVNGHDHIPGNWHCKIGQPPYRNTYRWLETYRDLPEHAEKASVWVLGVRTGHYERNQHALKQLGVFKNAIAGTTTVFDHLPRQAPDYYRGTGIRIVEEFRQTHSPRLDNIWGGDPSDVELSLAGDAIPFVTHLAEGVDDEARGELARWKTRGGLRRNLVIIHGVALTEADLADIAAADASVVWCPESNVWLLDAIMDLPAAHRLGVRVALGTDTSMTGSANLLEEMRLAEIHSAAYRGFRLSREEIFRQATLNAAAVCGLAGTVGAVRAGFSADLILLRDDPAADPLDRLFDSTPKDLALVIARGLPLLGDPEFEPLFRERGVPFTRLLIDGREKLSWLDAREPLSTVNGVIGKNRVWPALFLGERHYAEIAPRI